MVGGIHREEGGRGRRSTLTISREIGRVRWRFESEKGLYMMRTLGTGMLLMSWGFTVMSLGLSFEEITDLKNERKNIASWCCDGRD